MGHAPERMRLVETVADVARLEVERPRAPRGAHADHALGRRHARRDRRAARALPRGPAAAQGRHLLRDAEPPERGEGDARARPSSCWWWARPSRRTATAWSRSRARRACRAHLVQTADEIDPAWLARRRVRRRHRRRLRARGAGGGRWSSACARSRAARRASSRMPASRRGRRVPAPAGAARSERPHAPLALRRSMERQATGSTNADAAARGRGAGRGARRPRGGARESRRHARARRRAASAEAAPPRPPTRPREIWRLAWPVMLSQVLAASSARRHRDGRPHRRHGAGRGRLRRPVLLPRAVGALRARLRLRGADGARDRRGDPPRRAARSPARWSSRVGASLVLLLGIAAAPGAAARLALRQPRGDRARVPYLRLVMVATVLLSVASRSRARSAPTATRRRRCASRSS